MLFLGILTVVPTEAPRLLMAHVMPWFQNQSHSGKWGWHWTMNHFKPEKGEVASHYHPLIGLYDSNDHDVVEYQLLTMKAAGFDGILVDWYGIGDLWDYPANHRNTQLLFESTKRFGMKFAVVYEDQTLPNLIAQKRIKATDAVQHGKDTLAWLDRNWFRADHYARIQGRPALLVFGPQLYQDRDWEEMLGVAKSNPAFFTLHYRRGPALGAFDWPLPQKGAASCEQERQAFVKRSAEWTSCISCAYPRFVDIYKEAEVSAGYLVVEDLDGKTYRHTLTEALKGNAPMVQVATWNDWGEGTQIEPSNEFGYRDLLVTQQLVAKYWHRPIRDDVKLPYELYQRRKNGKIAKTVLDQVADALANHQTEKAKKLLKQVK